MADAEKGESTAGLGSKQLLMKDFGSSRHKSLNQGEPAVPVGGHPGNPKFYTNCELALRLTAFAMLLGSLVWIPSVAETLGVERFVKHVPLAICLMIFFAAPTFGAVVNTATAGICGAFMASLNIFILRGFFADGVTPGKGHFSTESIVGWTDLAFFNLFMLSGNFRPGFKITGMALNCGFMMCFLNPLDQTVFSKNFKINPNGAAVNAFLGTCLGSLCAVLAVLAPLPKPLGWATQTMRDACKAASQDTCKMFIAAVTYYSGAEASVLIDRQVAQAGRLKVQVDSLGGLIDAAYPECLDVGNEGMVRNLYLIHKDMLAKIFEILNAMQVAMVREDFGPSHTECMEKIGTSAVSLVEEASYLLDTATQFSSDGQIDDDEKKQLKSSAELVDNAIKALSADFHKARGKEHAVSKDLMSEAFFVFCLCAYGRLVKEYAMKVHDCEVKGKPIYEEALSCVLGIVQPPLPHHFRIVSRYWLALISCFTFAVFIDNYSPACAITAVFLINTRVGPDVMAMINGLLSVVVGVVCNALMFNFSCKYGNTQVLMIVSVFYWSITIFVAYGGSSLAGIGLIMAALAPFAILKSCSGLSAEMEAASAVGLWGGIRALLIAVVVTVFWEIVHIPGWFSAMSTKALDEAFENTKKAFTDAFDDKDVSEDLSAVSAKLGDAETFNSAAAMEPRFMWCRWKKEFLAESTAAVERVRRDVHVMRLAILGNKGEVGPIMSKLAATPGGKKMKKDLENTLEDARKLTIGLLEHTQGYFEEVDKVEDLEGLEHLDGFDEAMEDINKSVKCPDAAPESMEGDELCQMAILFVMLEYITVHAADITRGAVKLS
eukprot:TRINITY_DN4344_c0_g1_i1.p1 TRINITY_DN4344_c0_g1~~TRINITY_DN4344_c0_g1_i1.p1  ORF type:complete len:833 (+),score=240.60 TRINITY_DN4344_c0_g1_i1:100-2598(+)